MSSVALSLGCVPSMRAISRACLNASSRRRANASVAPRSTRSHTPALRTCTDSSNVTGLGLGKRSSMRRSSVLAMGMSSSLALG